MSADELVDDREPEDVDELDGEDPDHYFIASEEDADLAMKRLAYYQGEIDRVEALAAAERERVQERVERLLRKPASRVAFYTEQLIAYHQRVAPNGKRVKLINGDLASNAGGTSLVEDNPRLLLDYLESEGLDRLVDVKKSAKKAEVKKFMAEKELTALPGARLVTGERTWKVDLERPI